MAGLGLILHQRGFLVLASDEFAKAAIAHRGLHSPSEWLGHSAWLPGQFPLIAGAFLVVGDLLTATRLVSIIFGAILIIAAWRIGRLMGDKGAGVAASVLCATHPLVVWLSSSGLTDIHYAATFMLGLSYFFQYGRVGSTRNCLIACVLFALSCTFHYNAWIAVFPIGIWLCIDCAKGRHSRPWLFVCIGILLSVPVVWILWKYANTGNAFSFLSGHTELSAPRWVKRGLPPSARTAFIVLCRDFFACNAAFIPFACAALPMVAKRWRLLGSTHISLMLYLCAVFFVLFAFGSPPSAYVTRYMLLPSVLLILVVCQFMLNREWCRVDSWIRIAFIVGLVVVNLWGVINFPEAEPSHIEARELSSVLLKADPSRSTRLLLEVKAGNRNAVRVFLNDARRVIEDHPQLSNDSILSVPKKTLRAFIREHEVRLVAVHSDRAIALMRAMDFPEVGKAGTYVVFTVLP